MEFLLWIIFTFLVFAMILFESKINESHEYIFQHFFSGKLAEEDLLLSEPYCSYLREQRFYLDPNDLLAGYKCETFRPAGWPANHAE